MIIYKEGIISKQLNKNKCYLFNNHIMYALCDDLINLIIITITNINIYTYR